jgi:methionyl-tRNA formyltransferase
MTSVIFMGSPQFAVPTLQALVKNKYQVKAVVTQPDKKVGRKQQLEATPVKQAAVSLHIPVFQPAKLSKSAELDQLIALNPDLIITAAYGQFLPTKFLKSAKIAAVNVHGSLLPKYRGGAPIQYALMNGDAETGITIMEMVKQMDAGAIYAQAKLPLAATDTAGTVFAKLSLLGRDLLLQTLPKIIAQPQQKQEQDPEKVVFAPTIKKSQEQITTKMTAEQANNLIRALNPDPGAYLKLGSQRLKVWQAAVSSETTDLPTGSLVSKKKGFAIAFAQGTVLKLLQVQPAGKKRMSAANFANGQGQKYQQGVQIVSD